jgi:AcrR family transcriptional regulator
VTEAAESAAGTRQGRRPGAPPRDRGSGTQPRDRGSGTPPRDRRSDAQPPSRRDRVRAATKDEIITTARRLLVTDGPDSLSLRAIARDMGMTAPGLYRYFASHEDLVRHVVADIFTEMAADIHTAIGAAREADQDATRQITLEMAAACREFRRWSLRHPAEFALVFGVPLPGVDDGRYDIASACALQFAGVYFTLFLKLWQAHPFPVLAPEDIDPVLRDQLGRYTTAIGADIPVGTMLTFLRCWMLLYGAVAMEMFGHLSFALEDPSPMFDIMLTDLAALVGLRYPLPDA